MSRHNNLRLAYCVAIALVITAALLPMAAAKEPRKKTIVVAADGSGQFKTVQDAVDSAPEGNIRVNIKPGEYRALIHITTNGVELHGLGKTPQDTVLIYDNAALTPGPDGRQARHRPVRNCDSLRRRLHRREPHHRQRL